MAGVREGELERRRLSSPYYALGLGLGSFSKEHGQIFAGSNRAEAGSDKAVKGISMALVESVEMVVEVSEILVDSGSMPRALQFP